MLEEITLHDILTSGGNNKEDVVLIIEMLLLFKNGPYADILYVLFVKIMFVGFC
jgi:hypothetical protein